MFSIHNRAAQRVTISFTSTLLLRRCTVHLPRSPASPPCSRDVSAAICCICGRELARGHPSAAIIQPLLLSSFHTLPSFLTVESHLQRNTRGRTDRWLTKPLLSRKPSPLSISSSAWQSSGTGSSHCVQAMKPHYPARNFIITTAVKYWWLLASAECTWWRLSPRVMESNSSLYIVSALRNWPFF